MGLSSSKSTTKPVYSKQIEGAASDITNAYRAASPKITEITDTLGSFVPGLVEKYRNGDSNVNAARKYNSDVLEGRYLGANPYLDEVIARTGSDVRNQSAAALGTRGLTGGSAFGDIISRNLADSSARIRLADYDNERTRMDNAVGAAGSLAAAGEIPLASIQAILEAQKAPVQTAVGAGSGVGGLLGQYTSTKQTTNLGQLIASMAGNAASAWAGGGFK